ncbi:hypothetical protein GW17_00058601 [Ensete ventricosum]|nr:hypothetical protein GW17_00058601 [Ensete ventricosum]
MDALGSIIGARLPSPTNYINMSSRCMAIGLASHDALFHCSVTHGRHILTKASPPSKVVLQKAGNKYRGLGCRCSASETKSCVTNDDTSKKSTRRKRLAVFVSGGGSNFKAIHEATKRGLVHGDITVMVTDKPGILKFFLAGCGGAEYARDNQIPVVIFPGSKSSPDGVSAAELVATLR